MKRLLYIFLLLLSCSDDRKITKELSVWCEPDPEIIYPQDAEEIKSVSINVSVEATVWWTTNGKTPEPERPWTYHKLATPQEPITIPISFDFEESLTQYIFPVKMYAESKDGEQTSVVECEYKVDMAPFCSANPRGGYYNRSITIFIGCNEPCTIYYTTDENEPSKESPKASDSIQLKLDRTTTLKFFCSDLTSSSQVYEEKYYIDSNPPKTLVFGIEECKCGDKECEGGERIPEVVKCDKAITVQLIADDDICPHSTIYWSEDGKNPSEENLAELGGNTYYKADNVDIPIDKHTILKFFSKDDAGNREDTKKMIVLIGSSPFGYAEPPGGIYGAESIPLKVKIFAIPEDAFLTYTLSFPTGATSFSEACKQPCEVEIKDEGKNILIFRAFEGSKADIKRREDYILDKTPPEIFMEPSECKSDKGPIQLTLKANEEAKAYWKMCEPGIPCEMKCGEEDVNVGTTPVTGIVIDKPLRFLYCAVDKAGNPSEVKMTECDISGTFEEDFTTQDNMNADETSAQWGGGRLTLKRELPERLGDIDTGGSTSGLEIFGDLVFMADTGSGIKVVDISSLVSPNLVYVERLSDIIDLRVQGDTLLALRTAGLWAFNMRNPRNLQELGSVSSAQLSMSEPRRLELWGRYAVIGSGSDGIIIVDISNPQDMSRIGGITPSSVQSSVEVYDIDIEGNILAIAEGGKTDDGLGGLRFVDIKDPTSPSHITCVSKFLGQTEIAQAVEIFLPYVAIGTNGGRLVIFDISDMSSPITLSTSTLASGIPINSIKQYGNYLIVGDRRGLKYIDVKYPDEPRVVADMSIGVVNIVGISGNALFAGMEEGGLNIIRNSQISREIKSIYEWNAKDFFISGTILGFTDGNSIKLKSFVMPLEPSDIESIDKPADKSAIWGEYLVLSSGPTLSLIKDGEEINSVDLSVKVGKNLEIEDIKTWGDLVVVGTEGDGGGIYFLPVTGSDILLSWNGTSVKRITIDGNRFFLGTENTRLIVLKATKIALDVLLDYGTSGPTYGGAMFGDLFASAQKAAGAIIYMIQEIEDGRIGIEGGADLMDAEDVAHFGDYMLAANGSEGLAIVDITYPDAPRYVIGNSGFKNASKVSLFGDFSISLGDKLKFARFARSSCSYEFEGDAVSTIVAETDVNIKDAQIRLQLCDEHFIECGQMGERCKMTFELSNNGGRAWVEIPPNAGFFPFPTTGTQLMWRAHLETEDPLVSPQICELTIIYRFGK